MNAKGSKPVFGLFGKKKATKETAPAPSQEQTEFIVPTSGKGNRDQVRKKE